MSNNKEKLRSNKLTRALTSAGLMYSKYSPLIEVASEYNGREISTAIWFYDKNTRKEMVVINPDIIDKLNHSELAFFIKREFLHKTFMRYIKNVTNKELMVFALQCISHKILYLGNHKQTVKLLEKIYGKPNNVAALLIPGLDKSTLEILPEKIQKVWNSLWLGAGKTLPKDISSINYLNTKIPDTNALYYKLSMLLNKEQKDFIKENFKPVVDNEERSAVGGSDEDEILDKIGEDAGVVLDVDGTVINETANDEISNLEFERRAYDKFTLECETIACDEIKRSVGKKGGWSALRVIDQYFNEHIYNLADAEKKGISDYIKRWQQRQMTKGICKSLERQLSSKPYIGPYPEQLTELGQQLVALGICSPDNIPFYFNKSSINEGKKKVAFYFDTSPSMHCYVPYMIDVVNYTISLDNVELAGGEYKGKYGFSGDVKGITTEEFEQFKKGIIKGGWSTSFEAVARHAIDKIDVDVIVIFTDGYSALTEKTTQEFNSANKLAYPIYFTSNDTYYPYWHSRTGHKFKKGCDMVSDLDNLNGESFTIYVEN